uniref:Reverse transcriptase domain-containing protein n=1 Tax=Strongyloides papillosus TaxID=174720 RepID=A0A0N5B2W4_STREA
MEKFPVLTGVKSSSLGISGFVTDSELLPGVTSKYIPARKVPLGFEDIVNNLLNEWIESGIIESLGDMIPSCASPLMLAREENKKPRLCVDFSEGVN